VKRKKNALKRWVNLDFGNDFSDLERKSFRTLPIADNAAVGKQNLKGFCHKKKFDML